MKKWTQMKPVTLNLGGHAGLTMPRLVAGVAVATVALVVFVATPAPLRMAVAATAALAVVVGLEMWRRRAWQRSVNMRLHRLDDDTRRLMRDLARQRQDNGQLREVLATTGATLSRQHRATAEHDAPTVEQRMLRTIAAELSKLAIPVAAEGAGDLIDGASALDVAMLEMHASASGKDGGLDAGQVVQLVRAAIAQDRIDLFTQPVVTLPQRKTRFVEAFARIRIRAGVHMAAERYVDIAREQNLLPAIDNLLLLETLRALKLAAEDDAGIAFFCNITSLTLHDGKFMTDLVEFIAENRALAQRLVFELTQHDLSTMRADVMPVLSGLARLGCRFSLDQVRDIGVQAQELAGRNIRFIKIDADILVDVLRKSGGADRLQQLKAALDLEGIDLVATRVEREKQLVELLDVGIDYGQGYLFGHPHLHFGGGGEVL